MRNLVVAVLTELTEEAGPRDRDRRPPAIRHATRRAATRSPAPPATRARSRSPDLAHGWLVCRPSPAAASARSRPPPSSRCPACSPSSTTGTRRAPADGRPTRPAGLPARPGRPPRPVRRLGRRREPEQAREAAEPRAGASTTRSRTTSAAGRPGRSRYTPEQATRYGPDTEKGDVEAELAASVVPSTSVHHARAPQRDGAARRDGPVGRRPADRRLQPGRHRGRAGPGHAVLPRRGPVRVVPSTSAAASVQGPARPTWSLAVMAATVLDRPVRSS